MIMSIFHQKKIQKNKKIKLRLKKPRKIHHQHPRISQNLIVCNHTRLDLVERQYQDFISMYDLKNVNRLHMADVKEMEIITKLKKTVQGYVVVRDNLEMQSIQRKEKLLIAVR